MEYKLENKILKLVVILVLFQDYLKGTKMSWLSAQLHTYFTDCLLSVSTMARFQIRICIANQKEGNKSLYTADEEMGAATVDSQ